MRDIDLMVYYKHKYTKTNQYIHSGVFPNRQLPRLRSPAIRAMCAPLMWAYREDTEWMYAEETDEYSMLNTLYDLFRL